MGCMCACMHVCVCRQWTPTADTQVKIGVVKEGADDLRPSLFLLCPLPSGLGSSWVPHGCLCCLWEDERSCDPGSSCQMCVPWGAGIQRSVFLPDWEASGLEENWTVRCSKFPSRTLHSQMCEEMKEHLSETSVPRVTSSLVVHTSHFSLAGITPLPAHPCPPLAPASALSFLCLPTSSLHPRPRSDALSAGGLPWPLRLLPPEHRLAAITSFGLW